MSVPIKRARFACERCRARKQKCDSDGYNCRNCSNAGLSCEVSEIHARDYTKMLEHKVQELEALLQQQADPPRLANPVGTPLSSSGMYQPLRNSGPTLTDCAAFISLGYEPQPYLGISSGINLASAVQKALSRDNSNGLQMNALMFPITDERRPSAQLRGLELNQGDVEKLIDAYIELVHVRFPILDMDELLGFKSQWNEVKESLAGSAQPKVERSFYVRRFMLLMVCGTGLRHSQLIDKNTAGYLSPESFYVQALSDYEIVQTVVDIQSVQCSMLIVLYLLRATNGLGIWHVIGLAMRMCVELGLHRKEQQDLTVENCRSILMRRRVFWFCYSLERLISQSFGRPYSIADRDIDIELPFDIDDEVVENNERTRTDADRAVFNRILNIGSPMGLQQSSLSFALHFLRLRRIDSQIQEAIYRVDSNTLPPLDVVQTFVGKIEEWKNAASKNITQVQKCHVELMYNKSIRHTLISYLSNLPKGDKYAEMCLESSGAICRLNKWLHQEGSYAHSFVALQTVFMCGLTLIYAILTGKLAWDFKVAEDLQACSTVLFVVGERAISTKRYRDAFEALLDKIKKLVHERGPDLSNIERNDFANGDNNETYRLKRPSEEPTKSDYPGNVNSFEDMSIQDLWNVIYDSKWPEGTIDFVPENF
jgi:Fungal specific transcription factor domain/Fungal Zn(2)-Cys(6) binuclear cluster domain